MNSYMFFEAVMIGCFGVSWPMAIAKTLKTRSVEGVSIFFLWLVFIGYISGILFKVFEARATGAISPVIVLYIFNTATVGIETVLWYMFRKPGYSLEKNPAAAQP